MSNKLKAMEQLEETMLSAYNQIVHGSNEIPNINELLEKMDFTDFLNVLLNENRLVFEDKSGKINNESLKEVW